MADTGIDQSSLGRGGGPSTLVPADRGHVADDEGRPPGGGTRSRLARLVPGRPVEGPLPVAYLGLIAGVTVIGLLLRLPSFGDSLAGDEVSTFYIVHGHSLARVLSLVFSRQETTPPLYFILAWATQGWLGNPAESIRIVCLVTGTAAIPLTFVLGLWTVGRRAALVGATCMALAPFMIFFSTEARCYMLVLFTGLLSTLCLLRALETNRVVWWIGYAASTCAAVYSHYSVVFFLLVQLAWALWVAPRARVRLVVANVAALIGFLPWINGFRADLKAPNFITYIVPVNLHTVKDIFEHFWIGHPVVLLNVIPGNLAVWLAVVGVLIGAAGAALVAWRQRRPPWEISERLVLIVVLAIGPLVVMTLYSLHTDVMGGGDIIAAWPALGLATGALVTAPPRPLRVAAVTLTVAAYAIGGIKMLSTTAQRPNVAATVAFVDRTGKYGDPIVSAPFFSNPLTELDTALADTPSWTYTPGNTLDRARPFGQGPHPVIRLGVVQYQSPPLDVAFHFLAGPNPQPRFAFQEPAPQHVAEEAKSLARNGTVFLVTPITFTNTQAVLERFPHSSLAEFLRAMGPEFRIVKMVTYPGDETSESVYVFRDTGAHPGRSTTTP
jgi:Dolichyl-phosphate-mannose-protein mannosyltransferase